MIRTSRSGRLADKIEENRMNLRLNLILAAVFCCSLTVLARTADAAEESSKALTATVKAAGLVVKLSDLSISLKGDHVHLLFDAFPYRGQLQTDTAQARPLSPVVESLIAGPLLSRFPSAGLVKVDVVEFSQRDDYGAPRWDSIRRLAKFEASISKAGMVSLTQVAGAGLPH